MNRPNGDKWLFTPGPLCTSDSTKAAMLHDMGSRDVAFIDTVRHIRAEIVRLANASPENYTCVLIQGSGTYAVETLISSTIPTTGKILVMENGAYGERIAQIAKIHGIPCQLYSVPEDEHHSTEELDRILAADSAITHVALVHCETTTGILNPLAELATVVKQHNRILIVDAMSTFGSYVLPTEELGIDYLAFSSNKCLEGAPGIGMVLARTELLKQAEGKARTLVLDLFAQWKGLESNGQFRFTPPTHVILSMRQSLLELEAEGGIPGRAARYQANNRALRAGMAALGFEEYVLPERQAYIITTFRYPTSPAFNFELFYQKLSDLGYVIYPGKVSRADCFRLGNIGHLTLTEINGLLEAIKTVNAEIGLVLHPVELALA
jgi:2-aminoethylphosphonate-pyruvate transaminase